MTRRKGFWIAAIKMVGESAATAWPRVTEKSCDVHKNQREHRKTSAGRTSVIKMTKNW